MTSTYPRSSATSINNDLQHVYELYLPEIRSLIESCRWNSNVSQPFMMHVDDSYLQATQKILFVGRETFGWYNYNKASSAVELMKLYECSRKAGVHHNSPFWWFREGVSRRFGIDEANFMNATLWTNLSKIDVAKNKPKSEDKQFDRLIQLFIQLLVDEISVVKPDLVIIMTRDGFYNWHLNYYNWQENKSYFDSDHTVRLQRRSLENVKVDQLIAADRLPIHTYQMCHPNALRYNGRYNLQANQIIDAICKSVTDSVQKS